MFSMNSFLFVRSLRVGAALLAGGLAGCSRGPELAAAAPASAPVRAAALAPVPAPGRVAPVPAASPEAPATAPTVTVATAPPAPEPAAKPLLRGATYTNAGRVLDESGQPLVGATVLLRGSTYGTSTDATGGYMLEVPKGVHTLVIGYAGYEDETASIHDGQPLTVTLLPVPATSPSPPAKGRRGQR